MQRARYRSPVATSGKWLLGEVAGGVPIELHDPQNGGFRPPVRCTGPGPVDPLVSMTQHHPDLADEQAYIDHAYDCLDKSTAGRVEAAGPQRGRPRRHLPGPVRAQRVRRGAGQAAHRPRPGQGRARVRPHRPPCRPGDRERARAGRAERRRRPRELPHRPPGGRRRRRRAGRDRLAGARRRAVLPRHRPRADGARPPPALRRRRPQPARHRGRAVRRRPPRRRPRRGPRRVGSRPASCAATAR